MKTVFAIRHKPTGFYLPEPKGRSGRGGSFIEPVDCSEGTGINPRLLTSYLSAKRTLTSWLQGHHNPEYDYEFNDFTGKANKYVSGRNIVPVPQRIPEDMEIVEFELVEII